MLVSHDFLELNRAVICNSRYTSAQILRYACFRVLFIALLGGISEGVITLTVIINLSSSEGAAF